MEFTSLSGALIGLIPIYGPWIIFGIVAFESAGVPLPGETILVAAALLAATTGQINIVVVVLAAAAGAIVGDGVGYMVGRRLGSPFPLPSPGSPRCGPGACRFPRGIHQGGPGVCRLGSRAPRPWPDFAR